MTDLTKNGSDQFQVWQPLDIVKSKDANERRISGTASTERLDRQDEIVLSKGLDFSEFINYGWFNDNHNQSMAAVVGIPDSAEYLMHKGWHIDGFVLKGIKRADEIWELAKAVKNTKRKMGFSIEGKVEARRGNYVLKARIRNVAITNQPVNTDCTWDMVTKSFDVDHLSRLAEDEEKEGTEKALSVGSGRVAVAGGRTQTPDDLEKDEATYLYSCPKCEKAFTSAGGLEGHLHDRHHKTSGKITRKSRDMNSEQVIELLGLIRPNYSVSTRQRITAHIMRG